MVSWSLPARNDLKHIHDYIADDSKFYAKKNSRDILEKTEKLNEFPNVGRVVPEIGDPEIREVFIYSYRLIYEVLAGGVQVIGIIHGKQDFKSGNIEPLRK